MVKGWILNFDHKKGFGFIEDVLGFRYYVHISDCEFTKDDVKTNMPVIFEYYSQKQGDRAYDVKKVL